jgi:hypothetical protein
MYLSIVGRCWPWPTFVHRSYVDELCNLIAASWKLLDMVMRAHWASEKMENCIEMQKRED